MSTCPHCGQQITYCATCGREKPHTCSQDNPTRYSSLMQACQCGKNPFNSHALLSGSRAESYCTWCGQKISYDPYTGQREPCDCEQKESPLLEKLLHPHLIPKLPPQARTFAEIQYCSGCGSKITYCSQCGKREPCDCDSKLNPFNAYDQCTCQSPWKKC